MQSFSSELQSVIDALNAVVLQLQEKARRPHRQQKQHASTTRLRTTARFATTSFALYLYVSMREVRY